MGSFDKRLLRFCALFLAAGLSVLFSLRAFADAWTPLGRSGNGSDFVLWLLICVGAALAATVVVLMILLIKRRR